MYCKYCGIRLEDGQTVCSACGKDNAEKKAGFVVTSGKLALSIGAVVVLVAVLVALLVGGFARTDKPEQDTDTDTPVTTQPTEETVPPTVPEGTGLNDVTNKGTYTGSDEEVIAAMDTVVATLGQAELTNAQLQVYYWIQVQEFMSSEYGYYAPYLGLDFTQPLDTQACMMEEGLTWQQYFLKQALSAWQSYQVMANEAEAVAFEMPQEHRDYLDGLPATIAENATAAGFETPEAFLAYNVGSGAKIEDYLHFWELYYRGYSFFADMYEKMTPSEAEAEAYFDEHAEEYAENGITKDTKTVDVRHILLMPEGATQETIRTETFPEEAWEAARIQAQEILDKWLAEDGTEEGFAALANQHSVDGGSNTTGGLYTDVNQGEMVPAFDAWCFDAARQVGDYGLVKTEFGYHIMYFSGSTTMWLEYALGDMTSERSNQFLQDALDKYEVEVDYASILIGFVDMAS